MRVHSFSSSIWYGCDRTECRKMLPVFMRSAVSVQRTKNVRAQNWLINCKMNSLLRNKSDVIVYAVKHFGRSARPNTIIIIYITTRPIYTTYYFTALGKRTEFAIRSSEKAQFIVWQQPMFENDRCTAGDEKKKMKNSRFWRAFGTISKTTTSVRLKTPLSSRNSLSFRSLFRKLFLTYSNSV